MITFIHTNFSHPDFNVLIAELDYEFVIRYPNLKNVFTSFNSLNESARAVVAYDLNTPVACGAFRPMDETTIEIKRMYTRASFRNQGIGKRILQELEQRARQEGFSVSKLETGINQPEAIAAYEKSGYVRILNFPPYENERERVCMAKDL